MERVQNYEALEGRGDAMSQPDQMRAAAVTLRAMADELDRLSEVANVPSGFDKYVFNDLSVRVRNALRRCDIHNLMSLVQNSPDDLLSIRDFGQTSLNEVRDFLWEKDLCLAGDRGYMEQLDERIRESMESLKGTL
jgi:DNA-directed RNA polymerase alpha subunit